MSSTFIDTFDQFSFKPHFYVKKTERHTSVIPAVLGFFTYSAALCISIFFLSNSMDQKAPLVILNDNPINYPLVNLSDSSIEMTLTDGKAFLNDSSYFTFSAYFWEFSLNSTNLEPIVKYSEYFFEPCRQSDYNNFGKKVLENTFCLNANKYNLTISGLYGDPTYGLSILNLNVNRCINSTKSKVVCKPKQKIDEYLNDVTAIVELKVSYIDHLNKTYPFQKTLKKLPFPMSATVFKQYFLYLKNVIYTTDIGLIFEEKVTNNDFIYAFKELNVDLKIGTVLNPGTFGQVTLTMDPVTYVYKRSYTKLQTVLANAGGALKALQTFTLILCQLITKRLFFQDMINQHFVEKNKNREIDNQSKSTVPIVNLNNNYMIQKKDFENYLSDNYNKNKLNLNFRDKILPICLWNKNQKKFFEAAENRIVKELSFGNVIKKFIQFEKLKLVLLNETQTKIFDNLPRISPDLKNYYSKEVNYDSVNFDDPIVKKLLSSMTY
jgi:hypothetical protein